MGENIDGAEVYLPDVIRPFNNPVSSAEATAVLTGNLAPRGCVMKPSAAEPRLLRHRGKAIAFEDYNHMAREVERDDLDVTPDHILVLKNGGPKGAPGMPEWGQLPIPNKIAEGRRASDMLRISDARMSGTSYGACILHVAPESFVGGPLAFVQTGDEIEVDVPGAPHPSARCGRGTGAPARGLEDARATLSARLRRALFGSISGRPTRAAISIFWRRWERSRSRKSTRR